MVQPKLRDPRLVWALFAVAVVASAVLAAPYAGLDASASRVPVTGPVHYALLVAHIGFATVALVLGPLQFVPRIRARRRVHRAIGRSYLLAGVLPSALAGIPVAILSGRPLTQVGLTIPAVLWLVTGAPAVRAIRRGDVAAHRAWMTRNYALTLLALTARVFTPLLVVSTARSVPVAELIPIGQVAGWVVNLAVAEVLIRRRDRRGGGSGGAEPR